MYTNKIHAGADFPAIEVHADEEKTGNIAKPKGGHDWKLVVVYRGRHCPLCTKYLDQLESLVGPLADIGVDVAAVSGDSKAQRDAHREKLDVRFPLYYGLTIAQMQQLGLYISHPRSPEETDHPFPEPGLFVINADGKVQVVDISNNPFVRPELEALVRGLAWIRNPDNNYPIRGTWVEGH